MTLTKNEKILLEIVAVIAVFAVVLMFLVVPEMQEKIELTAQETDAEMELTEKEMLMANTLLDQNYEEQVVLAKKNYNYFYSVLNSYTIDKIINTIAQQNSLAITSLNISEYEDASLDFEKLEKEELKVLVKSTGSLTVTGDYNNILNFIDEMNQKSTCLRMSLISVAENEEDATGTKNINGQFRIYIYGIDAKLSGLSE